MQCQFCSFVCSSQEVLLRHHQLRHRRGFHLPCVYSDCVCSFRTRGALKSHLSRSHNRAKKRQEISTFFCDFCEFKENCSQHTFISHILRHLKKNQTVSCPFQKCDYATNNLTTFTSHTSRKHKNSKDIKNCIRLISHANACPSESSSPDKSLNTSQEPETLPSGSGVASSDKEDNEFVDYQCLEHKIARLFLCMQTLLHVSKSALQRIIEEISDILKFSQVHSFQRIKQVLAEQNIEADDDVIKNINDALFKTNPLIISTEPKGALSTDYKRNIYFKNNFHVIEPTEYIYKARTRNTFVYVSVNQVLENLLKEKSFFEKLAFDKEISEGYRSFRDGQYFKNNKLLGLQDTCISLALYIDDFEICNPLGTSRKIHKITAVYWVVLNLSARFRSTLHSIQLALLGKSVDVKQFGYDAFLYPLIEDLKCLESTGVYVESLNSFLKGTVFCVCADNLGAHSLAGFLESFNVDKFCRFCSIDKHQIAALDPTEFPLRTVEQHNIFLEELEDGQRQSVCGVKGSCALSALSYFHPVTGFPPDILHDFFEGVVPVELCLCLQDLIRKGFITFEGLNKRIKSFPYKFSDKLNKPQQITKASFGTGRVSGNGHENWTLLRLLPFIIGTRIPEHEPSWEVLMDLKELVEIVVSTTLSEEILSYLDTKILDHRRLLIETFPDFNLKPKHHYIEHYSHLVRCFGPLVDLWTIRFESKHNFFKKTVHDVQCFKNILLTLSSKHQQMMAYFLDGHSLFKPSLHVDNIDTVDICFLNENLQKCLKLKYPQVKAVSFAKCVYLYGTQYVKGMIISSGQLSGLPEFYKILNILVDSGKVSFVATKLSSWFMEHYRSYRLDSSYKDLEILDPEDLNDYHPLAEYCVDGQLMVTPVTCLLH